MQMQMRKRVMICGSSMTRSCHGSWTQMVRRDMNHYTLVRRILRKTPVTICEISYHRQTGFETWITSDGRAYLVQLYEEQESQPSASEASTADDDRTQVRWTHLYTQTPQFSIS